MMSDNFQNLLNFNYKTTRYSFSKGVIASYCNLQHAILTCDRRYIKLEHKFRNIIFLLEDYNDILDQYSKKETTYFSQDNDLPMKVSQYCYDLKSVLSSKKRIVYRGKNLLTKKEISITNTDQHQIRPFFEKWQAYKNLKMPQRYFNGFVLKQHGFPIYQKAICINDQLYCIYAVYLENDIGYELSFISHYFDNKLVNDLNDRIRIFCFNDLHTNYQIKTIKVGDDMNLSGLRTLKQKFPHFTESISIL